MAPPINILLVEDHAMFRQALAEMLEERAGLKVVGQCGSSSEALAMLKESGATLVLLDIALGPERALDFVAEARKRGYEGRVMVVTAGVSPREAVQLVQAGVVGILHKHHPTEVLCRAIEQVASGEPYLESKYLAPLFQSVGSGERKFTNRERTVLKLVVEGLTNREISQQLQISESAAKAALHELFTKLSVRTRAQLVGVALDKYRDQL